MNYKLFMLGSKKFVWIFVHSKIFLTFAAANMNGAIAQLVEQRTENPCVPSSILGGTTKAESKKKKTPESH